MTNRMQQREMMRKLVARVGRNEDRVCREYALAEQRGDVERQRNEHRLSADEYARSGGTESGKDGCDPMAPVWYYSKDDQGEYYTVYADANNSSSKRRFAAADGRFLNEESGGAGVSFSQAFRPDLRSAHRLGELNKRPNLQDAVRKRRLPDDVIGELRQLKRAIVG